MRLRQFRKNVVAVVFVTLVMVLGALLFFASLGLVIHGLQVFYAIFVQ